MSVLLEAVHERSVTSQALSWPKGETVLGSHCSAATNTCQNLLTCNLMDRNVEIEKRGNMAWDLNLPV